MCLRIKLVFYIQSFHLCRESVMKAGHSETRDLTILRDLGVRKVVIHTVKSSKYFYLFTSPECVGTEIYKSQIHTYKTSCKYTRTNKNLEKAKQSSVSQLASKISEDRRVKIGIFIGLQGGCSARVRETTKPIFLDTSTNTYAKRYISEWVGSFSAHISSVWCMTSLVSSIIFVSTQQTPLPLSQHYNVPEV